MRDLFLRLRLERASSSLSDSGSVGYSGSADLRPLEDLLFLLFSGEASGRSSLNSSAGAPLSPSSPSYSSAPSSPSSSYSPSPSSSGSSPSRPLLLRAPPLLPRPPRLRAPPRPPQPRAPPPPSSVPHPRVRTSRRPRASCAAPPRTPCACLSRRDRGASRRNCKFRVGDGVGSSGDEGGTRERWMGKKWSTGASLIPPSFSVAGRGRACVASPASRASIGRTSRYTLSSLLSLSLSDIHPQRATVTFTTRSRTRRWPRDYES